MTIRLALDYGRGTVKSYNIEMEMKLSTRLVFEALKCGTVPEQGVRKELPVFV